MLVADAGAPLEIAGALLTGVARLLLDGGADPELGSGTLSRGRVCH